MNTHTDTAQPWGSLHSTHSGLEAEWCRNCQMDKQESKATIVLAIRRTNGTKEVKPFATTDEAISEARRLGFSGAADAQRIGSGDSTVKQAWVAKTYDVDRFTKSI